MITGPPPKFHGTRDILVDAVRWNYWWVRLPARSASIALVIRARRVSAFFASSIQRTYSLWWV
jgi:hypothetical protein